LLGGTFEEIVLPAIQEACNDNVFAVGVFLDNLAASMQDAIMSTARDSARGVVALFDTAHAAHSHSQRRSRTSHERFEAFEARHELFATAIATSAEIRNLADNLGRTLPLLCR